MVRLILSITFVSFGYIAFKLLAEGSSVPKGLLPRVVLMDMALPKSFDPLDADQSPNINVMRMLYLRPIEVTLDNRLSSTVLEKFVYIAEENRILLTAKQGLRFSNQLEITVDDILLAILRMCFFRPDFPVLKDIDGIHEWIKRKAPLRSLPAGIKLSGQTIEIQLNKLQIAPLFRLTLELFSIVPKECINLEDGKLTCSEPPYSGFYGIKERGAEHILFEKRQEYSKSSDLPAGIEFSYPGHDAHKIRTETLRPNTVLYGMDLRVKNPELGLNDLGLEFSWLPASQFLYIALNPNVKPFDEISCRKYFAKQFRKVSVELNPQLIHSQSLFTSIVPGFLEEIQFPVWTEDTDAECVQKIKQAKTPWSISDAKHLGFSDRIMVEVMKRIDPSNEPQIVQLGLREEYFVSNKSAFYVGTSGFWAQDPTGDLAMFFTPNLHANVQFSIDQTRFGRTLLATDFLASELAKQLKALNSILHEESLLNIFGHSRRFFASKEKDLLREIPQAVSSPCFYQIFKAN